MKQKLFTLFAAVLCAASIMASDIEVDGIWYDFDESTLTATVTFRGSAFYSFTNEYTGDVVIPEKVTYNKHDYAVTSIGVRAFECCTGLTSVTIPNSVIGICLGAFRGCTGLTSITIPNSVTSIGGDAFKDCTGLKSITIPNSVTSIGDDAFRSCTGLTSVTIGNSVTLIGSYVFCGCTGLTSVTIPNSVIFIGNHAFWCCTGLTSVTIPNSVMGIASYVFCGCTGLTSITIPNSVTSIDSDVFRGCTSLTSVTIPNSVTSIGLGAFSGCTGLTSVTIPNSVTSIGDGAFDYCTGLTEITCLAVDVPGLGSDVFTDVDKTIPVYVPAGSVEAYKAAEQWKDFGNNIQPIQAEETAVVDIQAEVTENSAVLEWQAIADAVLYTIEIKKNGELICTLSFNELGQLLSIAFAAPSRNGSHGSAQPRMALQTANGWKYTITGLEANTTYSYSIVAKKSDNNIAYQHSITFTTKNTTTDVESVQPSAVSTQKIIRNGQVLILRDGKTYNAAGIVVR